MADPRQSYLQQLRAYAQPTSVYTPADIPASVRTYSMFDPNSNTWRRMTNDGRSPIPAQGQSVVPVQAMTPAQEQAAVAGALAQAQQTQGRVYSPLPQTPSRGSRTPSPASGRGGAVPVQGQPSRASQRAVEAPAASVIPEIPGDVSVRAPAELYQGTGIAPDGTVVNYNVTDEPQTAQSKPTINTQEIGQMFQPQGQRVPQFNQWGEVLSPENYERRRKRDLVGQGFKTAALAADELFKLYMTGGFLSAGAGVLGRALGNRAFQREMANLAAARAAERAETAGHYAASQANRAEMMNILRAQGRAGMTREEAALAEANRFSPFQQEWVSPTTPNVGAGLSRGTANYTNPRAPRVFDPMRRVTTYVPAPETPVQIIRPLVNTPASSVRLALPPGTGAIPMGRTPTVIRTPMEMTTPSGLARWQYRLDQLSGLGR